jgi:hypothetical protein
MTISSYCVFITDYVKVVNPYFLVIFRAQIIVAPDILAWLLMYLIIIFDGA